LDGLVQVLNGLELAAPKTKEFAGVLKALNIEGRCLLVVEGTPPTFSSPLVTFPR